MRFEMPKMITKTRAITVMVAALPLTAPGQFQWGCTECPGTYFAGDPVTLGEQIAAHHAVHLDSGKSAG